MAALHNAGLMIFVVLGAGMLYRYLGGPVPVGQLDIAVVSLLLVLVIAMQVVNDLGMMFVLYLRRGNPRLVFNRFTTVVEFVSAAAGVVLAIAFTQQSPAFFALLLAVLAAGMLVIMQYALMRYRLEGIVEERTKELRNQALEFERQATHDKLTGLPNRRYADDYLQQQIDRALRSRQAGAVALGDIDYFKRINDRYSHAIGDQVLERIATILADGCRKSDFVARYGGEEFLLCFPETDVSQAGQVCGQLRLAIQNADWSDIAPDFGVTISFGLAEITDGSRRRTVLNDADTRLYRAKREGRNRVVAA
jgi:diguanylate cyclase (GGDEF)-like protein